MKLTCCAIVLLGLSALAPPCLGQSQWVSYKAPGCKVLFPMAPTKEVDTVPTAIGKLLILAFGYEVPDDQKDQAENWSYGLFETVYPDQISSSSDSATLKRFWYGCENGAAQNVQGKILSDTVIQLNGYPGRAFRIDYQNGKAVITMRCYLVKHTMYMLQTITDSKKDYNSSMGRYMASFELDPNY